MAQTPYQSKLAASLGSPRRRLSTKPSASHRLRRRLLLLPLLSPATPSSLGT
jgi:hypothetical protein